MAIGFIGLPYVRSARALGILECDLVYMPTEFSVKTEEYPLARRLFLYTPDNPRSSYVKSFVQYALGEKGQERVAELEFVDLGITRDKDRSQGSRLAASLFSMQRSDELKRLVRMTQGASRLSVTFRFKTGSSRLDTRAVRDIERLQRYLAQPENSVNELLLIGFSDSAGNYGGNLNISAQRAQAVANELSLRKVKVTVAGFGEEAPVACNNTESGQYRNRHIEVWVR